MPVEPGKRYYFITHAYYHYVAEVVEITGKREANVKNVIQIHSSNKNWTEFFRSGISKDTRYDHLPDGGLTWVNYFEWTHPIPENPSAPRKLG